MLKIEDMTDDRQKIVLFTIRDENRVIYTNLSVFTACCCGVLLVDTNMQELLLVSIFTTPVFV